MVHTVHTSQLEEVLSHSREKASILADLHVMYVRLLLCREHVYVVELDLTHVSRAIQKLDRGAH